MVSALPIKNVDSNKSSKNSYEGGECKDGHCECFEGWTCANCNRQGKNCSSNVLKYQGGGKCKVNSDCGNYGPDYNKPTQTGGQCVDGQCLCFSV